MERNCFQTSTPAPPLHVKHPRLPFLVAMLVASRVLVGFAGADMRSEAEAFPPVASQASAYSQAQVELFMTSWCGYCQKARAFFQARGVTVIEYDIEKDPAAALRKRRIDTRPGVPLAVINGNVVHGFLPRAYEKALRSAANPPPQPKRPNVRRAPGEFRRVVPELNQVA